MVKESVRHKLTAILDAGIEGSDLPMGEDEVATIPNHKIVQMESQDDCVCSDILP